MTLKERIDAGERGEFEGLPNGLQRINQYIFGVQKKCNVLIGGQSGNYKTTLIDYMILNALAGGEAKGIPVELDYYSFEIDEITKKCNWLSQIAFQKYGVLISPEKIKGLGSFRLSPDERKIVDNCMEDLELLWSKINFVFQPVNPTGIYHYLWKKAEQRGKFVYGDTYINGEGEEKRRIKGYVPDNPMQYNLVVVDHVYLLRKERGFNAKEVLDKWSEFCMELRNMFGYSFFNIQQFNDGLSTVDRQKYKGVDLSPQMTDFKDTRNLFQDSDLVLGTMNPFKLDMEECLGYDINKLKQNFIMLKIIKNRLSTDNIAIGLHVNPKAGSFKELPKPNLINYKDYETT